MASPTVRKRRLARVLRQLRDDAGLTIEQVAEKLEISASTVSRMETAQVGVRPRDLEYLLEMYGVTGGRRDELLQIARERRQQPWWQEFRDLPSIALAGLEADAASIWQFSAFLVPGLLQTEDYAREVLRAIRLQDGPEEIERLVTLRMDRQALLTGTEPPEYWVVLDEAILQRPIGGPTVMVRQLQRLIDASELPNVTLQVLPFSSGAHAGMDGEFTLLRYREPADPDMAYVENTGSDLYIDNVDVTRRYSSTFDHLRAAALQPSESVRILGTAKNLLQEAERS
jgi:transcriptional regulator with XRE-family HTH domain